MTTCSSSTTTRPGTPVYRFLGTAPTLLHLKNTNQADAGNNFDCRWYDGSGNLVGRLTWVDGNPGTLTVQGTPPSTAT